MKIEINSLSKEYINHQVLNGVSFTISDGDRIGLVGNNGSGKTTILKILAGLEAPDSGSVSIFPHNLSIGYIPQVSDFPSDKTIIDCLATDEDYKSYVALDKLEITDLALKKFGELSSGQKTKVYLARLLIQQPDILLLDEPTNHLDVESLSWLENYLNNYHGIFLAVSHDRRFLDNSVNKILELDVGVVKTYGGNYSFYQQQKTIETEAIKRNYIVQEKIVTRIEARVRTMKNKTQQLEVITTGADHYMRRKAAKSASRAKSTEKMLDLQLTNRGIDKPPIDIELSLLFKPHKESGKIVLYFDKVTKYFDNHKVIDKLTMVINQGDRIALVGPNGSGKSTLINLIIGNTNATSGKVEIGTNVDIGYLPQEHDRLDSESNPIDYLINTAHIDKTSAYKLTKRFLLGEEESKIPVRNLSSGQKSKLALASIMASGANFIILDEPTNYLDIKAIEALESALVSYPGTLLIVSHDRYFLDRICPTTTINLK